MADVDLLPPRGVPYFALVDANGIAIGGTSTTAQLAAKGMKAICQVDPTGLASSDGASTVALLASRGIRAFAAVDENGVSVDDAVTKADVIRSRGIRPMVAVDVNGVSQTGPATIPVIAQRGLSYFCPVDETGTAGSLIPVPPNTIRARPGIFTLTGESMTPIAGYIVTAQMGLFALAGQNATLTPPAAAFSGPGDVAGWSGAYAYWGLRGYNSTKVGANCIDVCTNQSGAPSGLVTLVIGSDGYVNMSGVGFSPIYVDKIYDQIGTQHLLLNGTFRQVLQTGIVGGKPAILFDATIGGYYMTSINATAVAQPFTFAGIIKTKATFANAGAVCCNGPFLVQMAGTQAASNRFFYAGSRIDGTGTDGAVEAVTTVFNDSTNSSFINVNGVGSTPWTAGGANIVNTEKIAVGVASTGGGGDWDGHIFEVLIKGPTFAASSGQVTAIQANQRAIGTGF